jgi:hypothetical protein
MSQIKPTINLRHPGYDDEHNILLKLYAYDHPKVGIHYEAAPIACGIIAVNRWDGILMSSSEYHGESPPSSGVSCVAWRIEHFPTLTSLQSGKSRILILHRRLAAAIRPA